jgi:hypothetical protein
MKFKIVIFFIFISSRIISQHFLPVHQDTSLNFSVKENRELIQKKRKNELILTGIADYSGTSLGKDIAQNLFFGGEITDKMKSKSLTRHRSINRFGFDAQTELEYRNFEINLFKNEQWGLTIKAGIYNFLQAIYSKDFFTFPMYGNSYFSGDTAKFSGTRFSNLSYQKIGFGWLDKKSKSSISLNIFGLNNSTTFNIQDGEIFQNSNLDSLSFMYSGKATFSNSNLYIKGIGFGLDADLRWQSKNLKGKPNFQFLMRNVGFITQTKNFISYKGDTSFSYQGFSYKDLTNGATFESENLAILDTFGISKSEIKTTFVIPGMIQISKLIDQTEESKTKKFQEFYGARLYLSQMAIPIIFGGIDYNPLNGILRFGANLSYGGYSKLRCGFYSSMKLKNISLGIGSENVLSPTGRSIIFRLQCGI